MDKFPSRERSLAATLEPRVSAIVVAQKLRAHASHQAPLDLCLRSALAEPWIDDVVIVDQDNEAELSSALRAFQADRRDVRLVTAPKQMSAAAAANLGAANARGRWLLFLAPDVVLQRGAVERLAAAAREAKTPCVLGGRLTDLEGRDRPAARAGALNAFSAIAVAMNWQGARKRKRGSSQPRAVGAVSGNFMLIARADFENLGAFDERFATDGADLDLCRRAADAGGSVLFLPAASGVQFDSSLEGRRRAQGLALFAEKSARTGPEKAFAAVAGPALATLLALKDFVAGRPPQRRR